MDYIGSTLANLLQQTAFFNLTFGNFIMIAGGMSCSCIWRSEKDSSRCLLVPIAFGMLLVNIYPDIMAAPEDMCQWRRRTSSLLLSFWMSGVSFRL